MADQKMSALSTTTPQGGDNVILERGAVAPNFKASITSLLGSKLIITDKTLETMEPTDSVLFSDVSDAGNLKRILMANFFANLGNITLPGALDITGILEAGSGNIVLTNADGTLILAALEQNGADTDNLLEWDGSEWGPTAVVKADAITLTAVAPALSFVETDASADERLWTIAPLAGELQFNIATDAFVFSKWMSITRTLGVVDAIAFLTGSEDLGLTLDGGASPLATFEGDVDIQGDFGVSGAGVDTTWSQWLDAGVGFLPVSFAADSFGVFELVVVASGSLQGFLMTKASGGSVGWQVALPVDYDGRELKVELYWLTESGSSGNVAWRIALAYNDDGEYASPSFSGNTVDAYTADDKIQIHEITITPASVGAGGGLVNVFINRNIGSGSDTATFDLRLLGIRISYV